MAGKEISSKDKWEKGHKTLHLALKKEIALMREALANFHQEELALLENSPKKWIEIMNERSDITLQMMDLRKKTLKAEMALQKLASSFQQTEILPTDQESSCEILTQLDQLIALIERINLQNCRNDALFDQKKDSPDLPLNCPLPHPLQKNARRKTALATYPRKK